MDKFKKELVSMAQTFVATFLSQLGATLFLLPPGTLFTAEFWQTGGLVSIIVTVARAALKAVTSPVIPERLGGTKRG